MPTETHATPRNRRSFLRMIALGAGVAALVACGAKAAKPSLTEKERATLEALGDKMAADYVAGKVNRLKGTLNSSDDIVGVGIMLYYSDKKGWGIIRDENGMKVYVPSSSLVDNNIREGDRVRFDIDESGRWAVNVRY